MRSHWLQCVFLSKAFGDTLTHSDIMWLPSLGMGLSCLVTLNHCGSLFGLCYGASMRAELE